MTVFRHFLWGYELTCPDEWVHRQTQDMDAFAAIDDALDPYYLGPQAGQLLVRGEWNWERQPIEPLWNRHIGLLAGILGAKKVRSAPWKLGKAIGLEAEIALPKKDSRRLWTGILMHDFRVLHFMVMHPKETRGQFEPVASKLITSLRFPNRMSGIKTSREGLPLPPDYTPIDPMNLLSDIPDPGLWQAYQGQHGIGALQAFFLRELPIHLWEMDEYIPFPGSTELGFARFKIRKDKLQVTLGMLPYETTGAITSSSPANLVFKITE